MKVAYLLGTLNRGGAETLVLDILRNADKSPFEMIGIHRRGGAYMDDFYTSGPKMIECAPKQFGYIRYLYQLRQLLLSEGVSIVHAQQPIDSVYARLASLGTGIKVITSFHGHLFANASWWKRKSVYWASCKILCVSEYQKHYYENKWHLPKENKLQIVYNGIDFEKIAPSMSVAESQDAIIKNIEPIRLCMVGNFIKGRSQQIVIKAIHKLKKEGITDYEFFFIGGQVEKQINRYYDCIEYCQANQLDNVHFMGSRNDVPSLLRTMDGFVYSTEHDTFGIAVIEAISAGLPIVINDWAVMKEVCDLNLSESNNAIRYFRTDDSDDCATKMKQLLISIRGNREVLQEYCKQAMSAVKKKYSIRNHIQNLYTIYKSL